MAKRSEPAPSVTPDQLLLGPEARAGATPVHVVTKVTWPGVAAALAPAARRPGTPALYSVYLIRVGVLLSAQYSSQRQPKAHPNRDRHPHCDDSAP